MGVAERKAREKRQRREAILEAAKKVFTAKGFHGATMERIAREAELSPATLYLYFKNKAELYATLNLKMLAFLCQRMEQVDNEPGLDHFQKVRRLAEVMYDVYCFDPEILINVLHMQASPELSKLPAEMQVKINAKVAQALRAISKIFADGIEKGHFPRVHPMALSDIAWGVFTGLVLLESSKTAFNRDKDYLKPTLSLAMEMMARALAGPEVSGQAYSSEASLQTTP